MHTSRFPVLLLLLCALAISTGTEASSSANATTSGQPSSTTNINLFGVNPAFIEVNKLYWLGWPSGYDQLKSFTNPDLRAMLSVVSGGGSGATIRYPTGGPANEWDWRTASYVLLDSDLCVEWMGCGGVASPNTTMHNLYPDGYFSYDNYTSLLCNPNPNALGGGPCATSYVLNPATTNISENVAFLQHVVAKGIAPRWIEIGNEIYLAPAGNQVFPNGSSFVPTVKAIYSQGKNLSSALRFSVGLQADQLVPHTTYDPQFVWAMQTLVPSNGGVSGRYIDAISVHFYLPRVPSLITSGWPVGQWLNYYLCLPEVALLCVATTAQSAFPNTSLWVTEYGTDFSTISSQNSSAARSWLMGLQGSAFYGFFFAGVQLTMAPVSLFEMAESWFTLGSDNPFTLITNATATYATSQAQVLAHLANITRGSSTVQRLAFPGVPTFNNSYWFGFNSSGPVPYLQGAVYRQAHVSTVIILNRSNVTLSVSLEESLGFGEVALAHYDGNLPLLGGGFYAVNYTDPPAFPWPGPIQTTSTSAEQFSGTYQASVKGLSLHLFQFFGKPASEGSAATQASFVGLLVKKLRTSLPSLLDGD